LPQNFSAKMTVGRKVALKMTDSTKTCQVFALKLAQSGFALSARRL
jgi:hypothetical protein